MRYEIQNCFLVQSIVDCEPGVLEKLVKLRIEVQKDRFALMITHRFTEEIVQHVFRSTRFEEFIDDESNRPIGIFSGITELSSLLSNILQSVLTAGSEIKGKNGTPSHRSLILCKTPLKNHRVFQLG